MREVKEEVLKTFVYYSMSDVLEIKECFHSIKNLRLYSIPKVGTALLEQNIGVHFRRSVA